MKNIVIMWNKQLFEGCFSHSKTTTNLKENKMLEAVFDTWHHLRKYRISLQVFFSLLNSIQLFLRNLSLVTKRRF